MRYFDTHCHLNGKFYKEDIEISIERAKAVGVSHILLPGTTVADVRQAIEISKKHENVFAAAGIHPSDSSTENLNYLDDLNPDDIVAIGEVGIDLYWEKNPSLEIQKEVFEKHIQYAIKHNKPVIVHMRNAEQEVYDILIKYPNLKFVMHSFTSTPDWAVKFLDIGGYISISGIATFKNAPVLQEVIKIVPIHRILCETDSPFLTPVPRRGKHNKPEYVKYVADYVAAAKGEKDLQAIIFNNSIKFFNL